MTVFKTGKVLGLGIILVLHLVSSQDSESEDWRYGMNCENGVCYRDSDDGPCMDEFRGKPQLFRWEPIRVSVLLTFRFPPQDFPINYRLNF